MRAFDRSCTGVDRAWLALPRELVQFSESHLELGEDHRWAVGGSRRIHPVALRRERMNIEKAGA
jgi:hypothetical protein